jgi:hypothetical protein
MFSLALILSLLAHYSAEGCLERRSISLLDCSDLALETLDGLWKTERDWVFTIDFQRNRFVIVNMTDLLNVFPNLGSMDLRGNMALDCRAIKNSRIRIRSDCKFV